MKDWLTTKELADMAGILQSSVRQLILAGTIKAEKRGRDWFISQAEAQRWLDSRKPRKTE